jgi:hypothetical protein
VTDETGETSGSEKQDGGSRGGRVRVNCGRLDMRIARDGTWFYHGTPIGRKEMVRLFASVLERRADGSFWLATPAEEGVIEVDDAPFLAVELFVAESGHDQRLSFRTNVEDVVPLDAGHPLRMAPGAAQVDGAVHDDSHGAIPYLFVRKGLEARLSRAVYYELVTMGVEERRDGASVYGVWSDRIFFPLGCLTPE